MAETTYTPGRFVWRELMTTDVAKAKGFYGGLFGWEFDDVQMADTTYVVVKAGGKELGGVMPTNCEDVPSHWLSYVSVEDVDAAANLAKENGGTVPVGPLEIPNVGRFAIIADPDGAHVSVFRANAGDPTPEFPPAPGTFCWETLSTKDVARAKGFYGSVVGWTLASSPSGNADMSVFKAGDNVVADVEIAKSAPPHWTTYVVVPRLDDANAHAIELGATVLVPRVEVPNIGRISIIQDPTGAVLGLFEPG